MRRKLIAVLVSSTGISGKIPRTEGESRNDPSRVSQTCTTLLSVMLRPTEDEGLFQYIINANDDHDQLLSEHDALKKYCREVTDRNDMIFGKIHSISDYRRGLLRRRRALLLTVVQAKSPHGGQTIRGSSLRCRRYAHLLVQRVPTLTAPQMPRTYTVQQEDR